MTRVAALQLPHTYEQIEQNLAAIEAAVGACDEAVELVLLPECAVTGYIDADGRSALARFAEPLDGPTAAALAAIARRRRCTIVAPLIEAEETRVYNSLCLFDARGERLARWRKRHPWFPESWATPGDVGTPVVTHLGLKLTACICYDIHFIADDAPDALSEADVLLFSSAWVDEPGDDARSELLATIAVRFNLWVINANWGAGSPRVHGQGGSRVVDPSGRCVAKVPAEVPLGVAVTTVTK